MKIITMMFIMIIVMMMMSNIIYRVKRGKQLTVKVKTLINQEVINQEVIYYFLVDETFQLLDIEPQKYRTVYDEENEFKVLTVSLTMT